MSLLPPSSRTVPSRMEPDDQDPLSLAGRLDSVEEEDNMQNGCMELLPLTNTESTDEDLASEDLASEALPSGEEGGIEPQIELGIGIRVEKSEGDMVDWIDPETGQLRDCDPCTRNTMLIVLAMIVLAIAFVLLSVSVSLGFLVWKLAFTGKAFSGLQSVTELDLKTFEGLTKLRCTKLNCLDLSNQPSVDSVKEKAFSGLQSPRTLFLHNNSMIRVENQMLEHMDDPSPLREREEKRYRWAWDDLCTSTGKSVFYSTLSAFYNKTLK